MSEIIIVLCRKTFVFNLWCLLHIHCKISRIFLVTGTYTYYLELLFIQNVRNNTYADIQFLLYYVYLLSIIQWKVVHNCFTYLMMKLSFYYTHIKIICLFTLLFLCWLVNGHSKWSLSSQCLFKTCEYLPCRNLRMDLHLLFRISKCNEFTSQRY